MTLMDAQQYDEARDRRKRNYIIIGVIGALILAWVVFHMRNYPERHTADKFFAALQRQDIEGAYAIWQKDPDWKQHPQKYSGYNFGTFELDWGPTGEYGEIRSHHIRQSMTPKHSSGVVVITMINDRKEPLALWVERKDHSITFLPPTLNIRIEP